MTTSPQEKIYVSWDDVRSDAHKLAQIILQDGVPTWIIGVTVGGLVPLAYVAKALGTQQVTTISARSYTADNMPSRLEVLALPDIDMTNADVLLLDEIADTGHTLHELARIVAERYRPARIRTATLCVNTLRCAQLPDVSVRAVTQWVVFPWDADAR